jgi:hypothetical protein
MTGSVASVKGFPGFDVYSTCIRRVFGGQGGIALIRTHVAHRDPIGNQKLACGK